MLEDDCSSDHTSDASGRCREARATNFSNLEKNIYQSKITQSNNSPMADFSRRYKFSDWPNSEVPAVAAGVYAVWDGENLIYCGMSGREFEKIVESARVKFGLVTRLASHASGRLSGDQFCVYVANRLVIPSLKPEQLAQFATGELNLDSLTKAYINERLEYQFAFVQASAEAYALEKRCREGVIFGVKPLLNPA